MKKILLISVESINNSGDELLGITTEWLIKQDTDIEVIREQLMPKYSQLINLIPKVFLLSHLTI